MGWVWGRGNRRIGKGLENENSLSAWEIKNQREPCPSSANNIKGLLRSLQTKKAGDGISWMSTAPSLLLRIFSSPHRNILKGKQLVFWLRKPHSFLSVCWFAYRALRQLVNFYKKKESSFLFRLFCLHNMLRKYWPFFLFTHPHPQPPSPKKVFDYFFFFCILPIEKGELCKRSIFFRFQSSSPSFFYMNIFSLVYWLYRLGSIKMSKRRINGATLHNFHVGWSSCLCVDFGVSFSFFFRKKKEFRFGSWAREEATKKRVTSLWLPVIW